MGPGLGGALRLTLQELRGPGPERRFRGGGRQEGEGAERLCSTQPLACRREGKEEAGQDVGKELSVDPNVWITRGMRAFRSKRTHWSRCAAPPGPARPVCLPRQDPWLACTQPLPG